MRTECEGNANHKPITNNHKPKENGVTATRFRPPTVDDVRAYCEEKGYTIDAERFVNFYESKGWLVGKSKMKKWKAAVANWAKQDSDGGTARNKTPSPGHTGKTRDRALTDFLTDR